MSFKKYLYKKILAAAAAMAMVFTATGCGESTSWIAKYNDNSINSGIYIFYQTQAYSEATEMLKKDNEELDISDTKLLKTMTVENTDITSWINNKATERLRLFVAVNQKFDELGLSLTSEEKSQVNTMVESYWEYYAQTYEQNGIGKDSFKQLVEYDYKKEQVFLHYYGEGGEKECSDAEIGAYLEGNYSRVKTIQLHLTDGKGSELDDAGKKKIKEMAEDYKKRALAGEEFDKLIDEYQAYRDKLVEEATAENTEEAEVTTTAAEAAEEPAETTAAEAAEEPAETTAAEAAEEPAETTAAEAAEESAETTAAEAAEESAETTAAEAAEESAETTAAEAAEEPAETTVAEAAEEPAETTAAEAAEEPAETTEDEEADPYKNENIYKKGSEEDGYTPNQKVNDAVFNDCVVNGDPYILEDEEGLYIYVIQRLDILQRKDFFEEDTKINILLEMFEEEFETFALEWVPSENLDMNSSAVKRYDPFNIKL